MSNEYVEALGEGTLWGWAIGGTFFLIGALFCNEKPKTPEELKLEILKAELNLVRLQAGLPPVN